MNWKGYERKWSWPNLRYYPDICWEGLRETTTTKLASKTQETNGVELQGVQSPLPLFNSKNLLTQNKTDHINSAGSTAYQKYGIGKRYGKL
jgi:hypothetical protein